MSDLPPEVEGDKCLSLSKKWRGNGCERLWYALRGRPETSRLSPGFRVLVLGF